MNIEKWLSNQIENELFGGIPYNVNSSFKGDHYKMKNVRLPCIPYLIGLYCSLGIVIIFKEIISNNV